MRQRNYKVPPRKARESWVAYHDRLSRLIRQATSAGATGASKMLQRAAGKVAAKHKSVRDPRKRRAKLVGPGTYPWEQCVRDQKRRGARDPKAVCGRIRASSRKRYPLYWEERMKGPRKKRRKNPSSCELSELAYENMDTATDQIAHAFTLKNPADRLEQAMSAAMYAGAALANASGSDDRGLRTQAKSIAQQVRDAANDLVRPTKNPAKTKVKATKNPGRAAAIMRSFERL